MLTLLFIALVILLFTGFLGLRLALTVVVKTVKVLLLFLLVVFIMSVLFGWIQFR